VNSRSVTVNRPPALLGVSPVETLSTWLAEYPDAFVGAVSPNGAPVAIPPGITLGPEHQTDERSLLDLVIPEDTKAVADAFVAALSRGVGLSKIHMASQPARALFLQYLDLREAYGVLIRLVVTGSDDDAGESGAFHAGSLVPSRPRLGVMLKDDVAKILSIDTATSLMLGWAETDMVGRSNLEFIHPDDHIRAIDNWMSRVTGGEVSTIQTVRLRYLCKDGSWLWLETSNESHVEADGETVVVARLIDVSEEMAAVEALRRNEQFLRQVTDTVPVGLFHIGADGEVAFVNPVLQRLIGDRSVHSQADLASALLADQGPVLNDAIGDVMATGSDADLDISLTDHGQKRTRSACRINLRALTDGERVLSVLGCVVDVTELRSMADTDPLTGLLNRRSIMELLGSNLVSHAGRVAAIYLDLDHFKLVNDRHGHSIGDELLRAVADRLRDVIRVTDHVGRLGGDEFLIVCPATGNPNVALALARRIQAAIRETFELPGVTVSMTASQGVARGRLGVTADDLVSCADAAMYKAKRTRGGPPRFVEIVTHPPHGEWRDDAARTPWDVDRTLRDEASPESQDEA
jgi:diguanylate cyclase (GGDEF)-like protein/PAS domain S-box-containing protein